MPPPPPPPPIRYAPPVTEHVSAYSKSLCKKNMARASGGANNMQPLSWGRAQTEKIQNLYHQQRDFSRAFVDPLPLTQYHGFKMFRM